MKIFIRSRGGTDLIITSRIYLRGKSIYCSHETGQVILAEYETEDKAEQVMCDLDDFIADSICSSPQTPIIYYALPYE